MTTSPDIKWDCCSWRPAEDGFSLREVATSEVHHYQRLLVLMDFIYQLHHHCWTFLLNQLEQPKKKCLLQFHTTKELFALFKMVVSSIFKKAHHFPCSWNKRVKFQSSKGMMLLNCLKYHTSFERPHSLIEIQMIRYWYKFILDPTP